MHCNIVVHDFVFVVMILLAIGAILCVCVLFPGWGDGLRGVLACN